MNGTDARLIAAAVRAAAENPEVLALAGLSEERAETVASEFAPR